MERKTGSSETGPDRSPNMIIEPFTHKLIETPSYVVDYIVPNAEEVSKFDLTCFQDQFRGMNTYWAGRRKRTKTCVKDEMEDVVVKFK